MSTVPPNTLGDLDKLNTLEEGGRQSVVPQGGTIRRPMGEKVGE